eukprot:m.395287 g.395287  ORF g.395287 m.395287 type:complete len:76 (-) comp16770_c2_seq6:21-248(-)
MFRQSSAVLRSSVVLNIVDPMAVPRFRLDRFVNDASASEAAVVKLDMVPLVEQVVATNHLSGNPTGLPPTRGESG